MAAVILEGGPIARRWKEEIRAEIEKVEPELGRPHLVAVQVGDDPSSRAYVRTQKAACEKVGVQYTLLRLDRDTTQRQLLAHLEGLNRNPEVTGIIIQHPVGEGIDLAALYRRIDPAKDVEGMNPLNVGRLVHGEVQLVPCTALASFEMLRATGIKLRGREAVVVSESRIVGKPVSLLLLNEMATVTVCHVETVNLAAHTVRAEILITATGVPGLIRAEGVKPGAVVIDVGMSYVPVLDADGMPILDDQGKPKQRLRGDVDFESVRDVAGYLTPVPGGVGPVTVAMLMSNTLKAFRSIRGNG
jgi:methylenetetrahydrofolate dehydrogenase (NADP+)/methenyltetrahydrofolate cyclohydrolase